MKNDTIEHLKSLRTKEYDAGLVFSGRPSGTMIAGHAPNPLSPAMDPQYVPDQRMFRDLVVWATTPGFQPLWICGPTGSGKSSAVRQLAAHLNIACLELTAHPAMEICDLVGHLSVRAGSMEFVDGPLTMALRYGATFILSEADLLDCSVFPGLHGLLDGGDLLIAETGERVPRNPSFRFIVTANSAGQGDTAGLYSGVRRQNAALCDRFQTIMADYPSEDAEGAILRRVAPSMPESIVRSMLAFAADLRRAFTGEGEAGGVVETPCSTRSLVRWMTLLVRYMPIMSAGESPVLASLDLAIANRAPAQERQFMHELAQRTFGDAATVAMAQPKGGRKTGRKKA